MASKKDNNETLYRTSDIYYAAFLCAIDITLESTEQETTESGHRKIIFVFRVPIADLHRLKTSFFGGTATVKVQKFVQALRNLKSLCYT